MLTFPYLAVLCARYEPYEGFVEKMQGVTAIVALVGTGLFHSLHAKPNEILDVMWADLIVNLHLLSIARYGLNQEKLPKLEVVNMCGCTYDNTTFKQRFKIVCDSQRKFPFAKCFGNLNIRMVPCYYRFVLRFLAYQVLPSIFLDLLLRAFKMKPMAMTIQRKLFVGTKDLAFFMSRSFKSNGVTNLADLVLLSKESDFKIESLFQQTNDRAIASSYEAFVLGNRRYLLKEDDSSLPAARKRLKM